MDWDLETLRKVYDKDPFSRQAGVELVRAWDHEAIAKLDVKPVHLNLNNAVMGGALFTLADIAFSAAANAEHIDKVYDEKVIISLSSTIHFMKPATGPTLYAHAKRLSGGNNTSLFQIDITQDDGKLVSTMTMTGYTLRKNKK